MNRGLLVFAILVIFVGLLIGIYYIPLFGIFLLLVALVTPASGRPTTRPTQPAPEAERPAGPTRTTPAMPTTEPSTVPTNYSQVTPAGPLAMAQAASGYEQRSSMGSPALFPTTMFPSFTQTQPTVAQTFEEKLEEKREERKRESRDELLELVALLAFLRLTSS